MQRIHELVAAGWSLRAIARELGLSRNTVRRYLAGMPPSAPRRRRGSKLDPFRTLIQQWMDTDHLYNCVAIFARLIPLGYTGKLSTIKNFVHPLRPRHPHRYPVQRFETAPGDQLQFDWGEFRYQRDGGTRKLFGFTAILGYSRMRFVCFTKRCTAPSLLNCLLAACDYFGGLPTTVLTDRMKSVLVSSDGVTHHWNPLFEDWVTSMGITPCVCAPRSPQTKGKVERSIGVIKQSFWPGCQFTDLDDLNRQAHAWCDQCNQRVHATTQERPIDRWRSEALRPIPDGFAWQRFRCESRKVTWDGFVSYDGVLYGVPSEALVAGALVDVSSADATVTIWKNGQIIATHIYRAESGVRVIHPSQWTAIPPAAVYRTAHVPLASHVPQPSVAQRSLAEYVAVCQGGES